MSERDLQTDPKVIIALDFFSAAETLDFVERLDSRECRLKIGKQLFTSAGPALVKKLVAQGHDIFLDLKFHDIPNTVAQACRAASDLGVWMVNVHALGGSKMMSAASAAIASSPTKIIAVTLLTSSDQQEMDELGLQGNPETLVLKLAGLAKNSGMDGVVCSASEAIALRREIAGEFSLVTPGIRLEADSSDDQKRIVTPGQAIADGASYLVIGRPITQAKDPAAVLKRINRELNL